MEKPLVNIHADLIDRCRKGDTVAQYEIYKLYSKAMFNTALRISGSHHDAEDVLQEAFISAFRNLSAYRGEASFGSWLKRIVINKAITHLKRSRMDMQPEIEQVSEQQEPVEEFVESEDERFSVEAIKHAVGLLPPGFRSVLTLYLFEGYDHQEIAAIMNISESTSKTQYKRAKEKLKSLLIKEVKYG